MAILLIRHGESTANADFKIYRETPDHNIILTPKGEEQAHDVGRFIQDWYQANPPQGKIRLWASPYMRTTQTAMGLRDGAPQLNWDHGGLDHDIHFDARLREREWGNSFADQYHEGGDMATIDPEFHRHYWMVKKSKMGRYFLKPRHGESVADTTTRLYSFFQDLYFDMNRGITDHVIVTHGMTMLAFIYGFLKVHPSFMDHERIGGNTAVRLLAKNDSGRYADYGFIYDPDLDLRLLEKPAEQIKRDLTGMLK